MQSGWSVINNHETGRGVPFDPSARLRPPVPEKRRLLQKLPVLRQHPHMRRFGVVHEGMAEIILIRIKPLVGAVGQSERMPQFMRDGVSLVGGARFLYVNPENAG